MIGLDLAAAILLWILILAASSTGLVAIFRTATASIKHLLNFKPFSCDTCMSFWCSLAVAAAWLAFTGFVSAVDSVVIPAGAILGSVGLNYLIRQHRRTPTESVAVVVPQDPPSSTDQPPDGPPVTT